MIKILILSFAIISSAFAGEVTGAGKFSPEILNVLEKANITKQYLEQRGLKLGEVTGAGKTHVDTIEMIVTNNRVIHLNQIIHTDFKDPSSGMRLSDVIKFSTSDSDFRLHEVKAIIVK